MQIKRLAVAAGVVGALAFSLMTAAPALADYAPSAGDAVGVGSDTLQFAVDFVADGNHLGGAGYNSLGNANKWVNFDATADAHARLSYATPGNVTAGCTPGAGKKKGTGNATAVHAEASTGTCQLNNSIVLRTGLKPVQRPNGSGAGTEALAFDMVAQLKNIDYARSSDLKGASFTARSVSASRITVGDEDFAMASATTTNAVALTAAQIVLIYKANTNSTDNGFLVSAGGAAATGCVKWNQIPGNYSGSSDYIIPVYPQSSAGTYSFWQTAVNAAAFTVGTCSVASEENDPLAILHATNPSYASANVSAGSANAIEPMSGARLNLWNGKKGDGTNNKPSGAVKYFLDPSCPYGNNTVDSAGTAGFGATGQCGSAATSVGSLATALPIDVSEVVLHTTGGWWTTTRNIYIYFRSAELNNQVDAFQPGFNINLIRTLFANPCSGTAFDGTALTGVSGVNGCTTTVEAYGSTVWGPGGAPVIAQSASQALISTAGFRPTYAYLATVTSSN